MSLQQPDVSDAAVIVSQLWAKASGRAMDSGGKTTPALLPIIKKQVTKFNASPNAKPFSEDDLVREYIALQAPSIIKARNREFAASAYGLDTLKAPYKQMVDHLIASGTIPKRQAETAPTIKVSETTPWSKAPDKNEFVEIVSRLLKLPHKHSDGAIKIEHGKVTIVFPAKKQPVVETHEAGQRFESDLGLSVTPREAVKGIESAYDSFVVTSSRVRRDGIFDRLIVAGHHDLAEHLADLMGRQTEYLRAWHRLTVASSDPDRTVAYEVLAGMDESFFEHVKQKIRAPANRLLQLFKLPKIVAALKDLLGEVTVANFLAFVKKGGDEIKKLSRALKDKAWFLVRTHDIPTLTKLIQETETGLKAAKLYEEHAEPGVKVIDEWLRRHMPTISKVAFAALFVWIWLNVEEISWEPTDILRGFTGQLTFPQLVGSLPESAAGLLLGHIIGGVGYTIAPYMLLARIAWMLTKKYIEYRNGHFVSHVPAAA